MHEDQKHYLLDEFGLPAEDVEDCRHSDALNLLVADWAAEHAQAMVLADEMAQLGRHQRRLEEGHTRLPEPSDAARRLWAKGPDVALRCVLPKHRPHGLVELAVVGSRIATDFWPRFGDVPVLMEGIFDVGTWKARRLFNAAITDRSDDRSGIYIGPREFVEKVLEDEIPGPPLDWSSDVSDERVWVSAEAQAIGLLAERWDEWTALRACEFDTAGSA